jgi:hypothetical protein
MAIRSVFNTSGRARPVRPASQNVMIVAASRGLGLDLARIYLQNRLLPPARGGAIEGARGMDVAAASPSPVVRALDASGRENAERHHAYPGPIHLLRRS